jgi:hypothetical protein
VGGDNLNPNGALQELINLGYLLEVAGENLRYQFIGQGNPDPVRVPPLLEVVKTNKEKVRELIIRSKAEVDPEPHYDDLERYSIQREMLGKCDCGSPAWDLDTEGKPNCWCCLAKPGLFGTN